MTAMQTRAEGRTVLRNVSWSAYERLLEDQGSSAVPRLTYDRGDLEIVSPLPLHEKYARSFEAAADALALGLDIDSSFASTTFRDERIGRGFEADACFYVRNEPRVRGRTVIDPRVDPPPDVVVEIDLTHPSIPKLPIFAQFGVPEVWTYDGAALEMRALSRSGYERVEESHALPGVTARSLAALLEKGKTVAWWAFLRRARAWAERVAADAPPRAP